MNPASASSARRTAIAPWHIPPAENVFDLGIVDARRIGRPEDATFVVQFTCGCTVVVGGGHILLWPARVAAVCEHVRSLLGQDFT